MPRLFYMVLFLPILVLVAACTTTDDTADTAGNDTTSDITVGASAPNFTLPDAAGGDVSLTDYRGQPVLLYFHMAVG